MADFMSVQPLGGMGNAVRPTPPAPQPPITKPVETAASGSTSDYSLARDTGHSAANARLAAERRRYDDKVLTGPPPSFEASLLEVEGNLEATIRRIELAREKARQAEAAPDVQYSSSEPVDTERSQGPVETNDLPVRPAALTDRGDDLPSGNEAAA